MGPIRSMIVIKDKRIEIVKHNLYEKHSHHVKR